MGGGATFALMHMALKKRWWVAQKLRHVAVLRSAYVASPLMNSERSLFHIADALEMREVTEVRSCMHRASVYKGAGEGED